jgi:O-antigen/teichoic acid export membrane protein
MFKNAFANLCRGGAAALVAILLPPFLTRILSKDAYGTWLLILQLSTYVSFLDFGIQTAVGRYVAHCNELGDSKQRDSIISTSLVILTGTGIVAMIGISLLAWQLPNLFKDMPAALHQDAQLALLFVGCSLAIALPFNVFGAIFVGLQQYDVPAWIIGSSKLLGGLFVVLIAQSSHSIVMMGVVMGITNLLTGFWQYFAYKKKISDGIHLSIGKVSVSTGIEISAYCFGLLIWTIAMILIGGLDTIIIGYFDYQSVIYYTFAASLTSFLVGIFNSLLGVIMPKAAAIGAQGNRKALGQLLTSSTKYGVIILVLGNLLLITGANSLLRLWVGDIYAEKTTLLLQLLTIGNGIRYIGTPYSTIVIAIGEQRKIILSPLLEGIFNLSISVYFTFCYGVVGVAIGTICGGVISIVMHFFYNLPRTSIDVNRYDLIVNAIVKPLIAVIPAILFLQFFTIGNQSKENMFLLSIATNIMTWVCMWICVFSKQDRKRILMNVYSRIS